MWPLVVWRQQAALSQAELAALAHVGKGTIYNIEAGAHPRPRGRVMRAVAKALGVAPARIAEFRGALGLPPAEEH